MSDRSAAYPPCGYLRLMPEGTPVARTIDMGDGVNLDVDAAGQAVGIEIIGGQDFTGAAWRIVCNGRFQ